MTPGEEAAAGLDALADRLQAAGRALDDGHAAEALRLLAAAEQDGDVVAIALSSVARAALARQAGDDAAADQALADPHVRAVPLAPVLRALGRQQLRLGHHREALAAYARLACTQPEAIFEFWNALPPSLQLR